MRSFRRFTVSSGNIIHGSPIVIFSLVILFWTTFDFILSYITPILISQNGFSTAMIGLIIGSSSVAGAIFDFILAKLFQNTDFRRILMIMFALCFVYPILLWQANSFWFFVFVMAIWGIYYDLYAFAKFNFIGKYIEREKHAKSFGFVQVFRALGGISAPLIVGLIVTDTVTWKPFVLAWSFLVIGLILFITLLINMSGKKPFTKDIQTKRRNLFIELHLWRKIGRQLNSVLALTFYLFFIDAFFWTLAPLYAESVNIDGFGSLFLSVYILPTLIVSWFITPLANKFGKKKMAYSSLLIGSLILSLFFIASNPISAVIIVFIASCFISMALPAINSSYADYIDDAPQVEGEIEGLEDFFTNIGYVVGPLTAGILAQLFGMSAAFSILGIFGALVAIGLLIFAPKHIVIKTKKSEL